MRKLFYNPTIKDDAHLHQTINHSQRLNSRKESRGKYNLKRFSVPQVIIA